MPVVGEKGPSCQVKRVQCPRSVEGSRQQGEIRLGESLSPPEQAHDDKEISIEKKGRRSFDTAIEYGTVAIRATEKTRTAKSAVRATCSSSLPRSEVRHQCESLSTSRRGPISDRLLKKGVAAASRRQSGLRALRLWRGKPRRYSASDPFFSNLLSQGSDRRHKA